jgi:hypothetical protein
VRAAEKAGGARTAGIVGLAEAARAGAVATRVAGVVAVRATRAEAVEAGAVRTSVAKAVGVRAVRAEIVAA